VSAPWQGGITIPEYRNFVTMSEPWRAAEVLLAGIVERANLAAGSSGGYTVSGSAYEQYGSIPLRRRFPFSSDRCVTPAAEVMSRFANLVYQRPWVIPEDFASGGRVRLWNDHMPELMSRIGLGEFADPAQSTWFRFPHFCSAQQAKIYLGVASGLSLLEYVIDTHMPQIVFFKGYTYGYGNDETPFSITSSRTQEEEYSNINRTTLYSFGAEYFSASRDRRYSGLFEAERICPLSITVSNGGICPLYFSAVYSGNIGISASNRLTESSSIRYEELEPTSMRAVISGGGTMTFPISGCYTSGRTLLELVPDEIGCSVAGSANVSSGGWQPYGGFIYSGLKGGTSLTRRYDAMEIRDHCLFFPAQS